jgi:hypothetical protein
MGRNPSLLPGRIIACDKTSDTLILQPVELLRARVSAHGVCLDFRQADLFEVLASMPKVLSEGMVKGVDGVDLISATGVCSYLVDEAIQRMCKLCIERLKPGGKLVIDLQLERWVAYSVLVLGWDPGINPSKDRVAAVEKITQLLDGLNDIGSIEQFVNPNIVSADNVFEILFVITKGVT